MSLQSAIKNFGLSLTVLGFFLYASPAVASGSYWKTDGNRLVDGQGQTVKFAGVNWFGLETGTFAPHGLWSRGYKEMMDQMKSLGFNAIRLPYSNQLFDATSKPNGIDYAKNPDLQGLSGVEVMDRVIAYAGQLGMKVILDQHRPDSNGQSSLWYSSSLSEEKWISDWVFLAQRYSNNPTVVAADLHNEPHQNACWGCGDPRIDWKLAAEKAGNAILSVNPNMLIVVEGVEVYDNNWYWWGGNLRGVKNHPVKLSVPNRVVYSTHDYPSTVNPQAWFSASNYPSNLPGIWDATWGYIHKNNIAPVLVGEFGSKLDNQSDALWLDTLVKYMGETQMSWTFWSWNPNSGDTGGILEDDWQTVRQDKVAKIKPIMAIGATNFQPVTQPQVVAPTPTPSSLPTPSPAPSPLPLLSSNSVTIAPSSPTINDQVSITVPVTHSTTVHDVIVDVEIFNSQGQKVHQAFYDKQTISPAATSFTVKQAFVQEGTYRVAVGIFSNNCPLK